MKSRIIFKFVIENNDFVLGHSFSRNESRKCTYIKSKVWCGYWKDVEEFFYFDDPLLLVWNWTIFIKQLITEKATQQSFWDHFEMDIFRTIQIKRLSSRFQHRKIKTKRKVRMKGCSICNICLSLSTSFNLQNLAKCEYWKSTIHIFYQ